MEQTTIDDWTGAVLTDGGAAPEERKHFDPEAETVMDAWEGVFIYTSWGWEQTNVEFAQIVEVSDSGKTVLARLVGGERVDAIRGSEQVRPTAEPYSEPFRLHVRASRDSPSFRGSYPYIDGDPEKGTRLDSFLPFSNSPEASVHQTPTNHGH